MLKMLMQKKNYKNSTISPCKNIIFIKSSKRNQNPSTYYFKKSWNQKKIVKGNQRMFQKNQELLFFKFIKKKFNVEYS